MRRTVLALLAVGALAGACSPPAETPGGEPAAAPVRPAMSPIPAS
jgi:hypothetical protein